MGLLELNLKQMQRLVDEPKDELITWAYDHGKWDVRLMAVDYYTKQESELADSFLKMAMYDDIELISQKAMSELEKRTDSEEIHQFIVEKRQFWIDQQEYSEGRRNRTHLKSSVLTEPKERGSKKTLDNVRNMLKKPMNGGKWF
jgi:hypothetical protein